MGQNWETFGHNQVKRILDLQLTSGRFAHAYLFLGPESVGKKMLALELAKKILGVSQLNNHPDFSLLSGAGEIDIKSVRELTAALSFKPFAAKNKVAIVNDAQNLNLQAQNALLKTLEEPSSGTVLILISTQRLLDTIVSRCQTLHFNRFSPGQMGEFAGQMGIEASPQNLNLAFGLPGALANKFLGQKEAAKEAKISSEALENFNNLEFMPLSARLLAARDLAEKEPQELTELIDAAVSRRVLELRRKPENYKNVLALLAARAGLKKNFNRKLVAQKLVLSF